MTCPLEYPPQSEFSCPAPSPLRERVGVRVRRVVGKTATAVRQLLNRLRQTTQSLTLSPTLSLRGRGSKTAASLFFTLFLLVLAGCSPRPAPLPTTDDSATWQDLPNAPVAVMAPAASISGRNWIVTGGIRADGTPNPDVLSLDLDHLTWSTPTRLEHPRFHHDQVTLEDGRVLVIGGRRFGDDARYEALTSCELITGDRSAPRPTCPNRSPHRPRTSCPTGVPWRSAARSRRCMTTS